MNLYRAFATVGGMTMLSRILGFAREILIAFFLGAASIADAFVVAFRFPNLFRRIFAEGAFNSAFIPLFAKKLENDTRSEARRFAEDAMAWLLCTLLLLLAITEIMMPWLIYVIAPGFTESASKVDIAVLLSRIMFPYLLFVSIGALLSGILNAFGKFALAAAAPVVLNIVLILVMLIIYFTKVTSQTQIAIYMSWGVFVAGVLQLLLLVYAVQKENMALEFRRPRFTPEMKRFFILAIPGIIVGAVTQINLVIGQLIVSFQDGANALLYYADRIYQLPLGMIGVAIGVVLLPDISGRLRAGDIKAVHNSQNRSLEFCLLLTVPSAVALFIAAEPIVRVLFERGAFNADNTVNVAKALSVFALGLPGFVLIKVFSPVFFAREDTKTPMKFAIAGMAVNTVLSIILYRFMGYVGIALATTLSGWLTAGLLWNAVRINGHFKADQQLISVMGPILISSVIMGGIVWFGVQMGGNLFEPSQGILIQILSLLTLVFGGVAIYAASAHVTGAVHIPSFLRTLTKKKSA